ncbi:MAG: hypothetical protein A2845_04460 [Candidatus Lloydbacteria bacterium RIFCSPHIGHO2_01_FULL_49_22]|uniref:Transcriptional regulator n=1 Tax=Candidatus Lloydbacteria bacterium RIFCSPHIGHO2_01_FULL_49_22 TaxID=1798658 RepID=A0A1G2CWU5_9BACT|nr:MAG: hypothetical protein A2845_04460 [Candidatus Lloydbacteria bacterium RIFCSPHIGHO2_01_FULL_49_22]OGZ08903.1 MAG: hypothetical protein A3C14_01495 [Candidatus Lloydbacteria bacterium RIFCSPHIGHO2_02_FULL_50_18]
MKNSQELNKTADEREALLHRLNRIQGQIEGIKRSVESDKQGDCLVNIGQIKAVHVAVKRFAEAYIDAYAITCAKGEGVSLKFEKDIRTVVASAFSI